ncbi:hypothetical protein M426DRAFT_317237 [Hypoxylon sp. CI-4A]|nr:hypothetical protein M426DRAFT_317237 [Hypoxylon sp. CI-4A]
MFLDTLVRRAKHESKPQPLSSAQVHPEEPENARSPGYPYQPLSGTDIRLFKIILGEDEDDIQCQVDLVPLDPKPTYYALSYVWGDSSDLTTITLNGQLFKITKNLYEALHQFKHEYPSDYMWADAICINQQDADEKSREVPRMVEIYQMCSRTLIWLGPNGPPLKSRIRKLLRKVPLYMNLRSKARHIDKLFHPTKTTADDVVGRMLDKRLDFWFALTDDDDGDSDDAMILREVYGKSYDELLEMFTEIMERPWFQRAWTLQEACIPADPDFYIGQWCISFNELNIFIRILGLQDRTLLMGNGMKRMLAVSQIRHMRRSIFEPENKLNPIRMNTAEVLTRLISLTSNKQCEDPRDQIYGIIGLVDFLAKDIPPELMPDYHQPYEELYWKCMVFILESIGDLRLLSFAWWNLKASPSWVTDFRYVGYKVTPPKCQRSVSFSPDKRTLILHGFIIGTYENYISSCSISAVMPHPDRTPKALSVRLRSVEERILKPSAELRGTTVEDSLDGFLMDGKRAYEDWELSSCRQIYHHLCDTYGERSWLAKRKTDKERFLKEYAIAYEFRFAFMLLSNGTVVRQKRWDVKPKPGDLVCLFKGAMEASIVRPCGENYTFLSQCDIRTGQFLNEEFNDDFWVGRELEEFRLV